MEKRYGAVTMVMRDGFSITDIAAKFNVTRQTVYRWLAKYEAGGLEALADESHRPHSRCFPRQRGQSDDAGRAMTVN
jgi:transposase